MAENPLVALSDHVAALVERVAGATVAVHAGRSWSSGIHWRSGVIVTAEEVLDRDDDIKVVLAGGREVVATLAGRDPTTDVAVLRFQPDGLPAAETADSGSLRPGHLVLAVGGHRGDPVANLGSVAFVGGAWMSQRGGSIDTLLRLDLTLSPAAEGGALVDAHGRVLGMVVAGPRGRVLAIPRATIDRAVDQLLAKGYVGRGYLGASLQPIRRRKDADKRADMGTDMGVLVVGIDPDGPAARAGLIVGDIVTAWNAAPIGRVREVMRLLGPDSVGNAVDLALSRGGAATALKIVIGERPRH
jgi:S1-C subfamily serine protease